MALSGREILLVIRARDEATQVLNSVSRQLGGVGSNINKLATAGATLSLVGTGLMGVGAAAVVMGNRAVDSFVKFDTAARLTHTQVKDVGVSLEDIKDIALRVGKQIPVPFEQLQPALYDIFSSIKVNTKEAEIALGLFAKAGAAGMVDVSTAARGAFTIMNNFGYTAKDLNRILDVQFAIVRSGIGEYKDVAQYIGTLSQGADRAGQSIETMGGAFAFASSVTGKMSDGATQLRNVLNALGKTKVQEEMLKTTGVRVLDASGNFRDLRVIVNELGEAFKHMSAGERAAAIDKMFKTGSSSSQQVMRFMGSATSNLQNFNRIIDEVTFSGGAMDEAFQKMNGPAFRMQEMKNKAEILRIEIGEKLLPIKLKLMQILTGLMDKWNSLSPRTQDIIIKFAAVAAITVTVVGAIMTLVGVAAMIIASFAALGVGAGAAGAIIGGLVAVVAGVSAAFAFFGADIGDVVRQVKGAIAMFKQTLSLGKEGVEGYDGIIGIFEDLGVKAHELVKIVKDIPGQVGAALGEIGGMLRSAWNFTDLADGIRTVQREFKDFAATAKTDLKGLWSSVERDTKDFFKTFKTTVGREAKNGWKKLEDELAFTLPNVGRHLHQIGAEVSKAKATIGAQLTGFWDSFSKGMQPVGEAAGRAFHNLANIIGDAFSTIKDTVKAPLDDIGKIIKAVTDDVTKFWHKNVNSFLDPVSDFAKEVVRFFNDIAPPAREALGHVISLIKMVVDGLVTNLKPVLVAVGAVFVVVFATIKMVVENTLSFILWLWKSVGDEVLGVVKGAWMMIWGWIKVVFELISGIVKTVLHIINGDWGKAWNEVKDTLVDIWNGILSWFKGAVTALWNIIKGVVNLVVDGFKWLWNVLVGHSIIPDIVNGIIDWFTKLPSALWNLITGLVEKLVTLFLNLLGRVLPIIGQLITGIVQFFIELPGKIVGALGNLAGFLWQKGVDFIQGLLNGMRWLAEVVWAFYRELPGRIVGFVGNVAGLLWDKGRQILQSAINGWHSLAEAGWDFFQKLPGRIVGAVGNVTRLLWDKGREILHGAIRGWESLAENAWNFFRNLPRRVVDSVGNVYRTLWNQGRDLLLGLIHGWESLVGHILRMASGVWRAIRDAVGDLGGALWGAGRSVVQGLINGIESMMGPLRSTLGWVTSHIPDWKGPLTRDERILVGNGVAVMGGFIKGIESQTGHLRRTLGAVTATLPSTVAGALSAPMGGSGGGASVVTIAPGAVQLTVQGNLDSSALPEVERMIDRALGDLADQLSRRR